MTMTKQYKEILEYLQNSHSGARMMKDMELELRIARAIIAFEADTHEDIFVDDLIEREIEKEMSETIHYKVKQEVDGDLIKVLRCLGSQDAGRCYADKYNSENPKEKKISCVENGGCPFYQDKYHTGEPDNWLNKVADILEGK